MNNNDERLKLFDQWASNYDVTLDKRGYPFLGYEEVLDGILARANVSAESNILDIGTGTGNLAERFIKAGCHVTGTDFSADMLTIAAEKFPSMTCVQFDLLSAEWPAELGRYDAIVSAYVLHELALPDRVEAIKRLVENHLAEDGVLVIGDIAFPTQTLHDQAYENWSDRWDTDEYPWVAENALRLSAAAGIELQHEQISSCAAIFSTASPSAAPSTKKTK